MCACDALLIDDIQFPTNHGGFRTIARKRRNRKMKTEYLICNQLVFLFTFMSNSSDFNGGDAPDTANFVQQAVYPFTDYVPFPSIDYNPGQNLASYNTPDGCNIHCNQTASCIGFVSGPYGCWLRAVNSYPTSSSSDITAYYQVQPQREYTVFNAIDFPSSVTILYFNGSRNQCHQACDALPQCIGYVII